MSHWTSFKSLGYGFLFMPPIMPETDQTRNFYITFKTPSQVSLGVIAAHGGKEKAAQEHFQAALNMWKTAWEAKLQSPYGLLQNKALVLSGLGRSQEALETLRQALETREPGETIEMDRRYHLLAQAPHPPPELEAMLALLEAAANEAST